MVPPVRAHRAAVNGWDMLRAIRVAVVSIAAATAALPALAQAPADPTPPKTLAELEQRLGETVKQVGLTGFAVTVVENGQVVLTKGFGLADAAGNKAVTPDTVFRIGSISKTFTGLGAMSLVEQGKLDLNARVADLAPEIKFNNPWEDTDPLRVVHLIEHTTGWPDISNDIYFKDGTGWTLKQGIDYGGQGNGHTSRWKPGMFSIYSNEGPAVAGYIMEKAAGQGFSELIRTRVLRPMGMVDADFDPTPALKARLAKSYEPDGSESPYVTIILPPSGSMMASANEMSHLVRLFLGRGTIDGVQVLKPESIERVERQESSLAARNGWTGGYGLGNAPFPSAGPTFRGHNGGIDAFTSIFAYNLQSNSGYAAMANGGASGDYSGPVTTLIQGYLTRNMKPEMPPEHQMQPAQLEKIAGFYTSATPRNEYLRIYEDLTLMAAPLTVSGNHLLGGDTVFVPVTDKLFRRNERAEVTNAFVESEGQIYRVGVFNTQKQVPLWFGYTKIAVVGVIAIGAAFAVLLLPFQIYGWFTGKVGERGGLFMRVAPLLAVIALAATLFLPILAILTPGGDALKSIATQSPYSWTILVLSILFPALAVFTLWRAVTAEGAGLFVRAHTGLLSLAILAVAAYLSTMGWIGVQTWTW